MFLFQLGEFKLGNPFFPHCLDQTVKSAIIFGIPTFLLGVNCFTMMRLKLKILSKVIKRIK